ncbi:MAG: helix-turn-helix transcriptional regulator [Gracilibacteraceae bacterium]|jgi:putative molybdopterin biosynthesis protein|nr:helix-turn-helix transcriptional regulator [Gracilibacteraceae bacterium]
MESLLLTAEEVAQQLKIRKYTVYELIKRGELPSSKVGKQVRISQSDINHYLQATKSGKLTLPRITETGVRDDAESHEIRTDIFETAAAPAIVCGQDTCLDMLVSRAAAQPDVTLLRSHMGSLNGLYAFYHGRVSATAAHLWDAETNSYNFPFIRRLAPGMPVGALRLVGRMQGFYVKKGNPLEIKGWRDLARPEVNMVNREKGSGTRILLDQKLALCRIHSEDVRGYKRELNTHLSCASAVAKGEADVGCGCAGIASNLPDIEFVPLQLEWYDLIFRLADRNTPAIQSLLAAASSLEYRRDLEMLGDYDLSQTGYFEEL